MKLPKVKFLTVVWGERYIERFCTLSLPSFLAEGNLPSLAESSELEVVIMTRASDVSYFSSNAAFIQLSNLCSLRFVPIDDLITTGIYGVTLTLAYARPIIACGEDMVNTHFVFMNADFVLADGSLRSLIQHINAGRSIVLGPSYRAIAEEVEPILEAMVDRNSNVLTIPPRQLVGLSLPYPHRTTVAKMRNQTAFSSTHPNQLFWQVDENTVLGRYFLIFMLCLKPERVMRQVNCYCDYSFIPELCPSGDEVAMSDSDDFFMLELQSQIQETSMLRQGQLPFAKIAGSLNEWTTKEHRRAASYDVVFHSGDLPPKISDLKRDAEEAVSSTRLKLGSPKSHKNHHYWVMGVEAWKEYRQRQGLSYYVPELAPYTLGLKESYLLTKHRLWGTLRRQVRANPIVKFLSKCLRRVEQFVIHGYSPASPASAYWQEALMLKKLGSELRASGLPVLVVVNQHDSMQHLGALPVGSRIIREECAEQISNLRERYARVVFFPSTLGIKTLMDVMGQLLEKLDKGGVLHTVLDVSRNAENYFHAVNFIFRLGELAGNHLHNMHIKTAGGWVLTFADLMGRYARRRVSSAGRKRRLVAAIILAPVVVLSSLMTRVANTLAFTGFGNRVTPQCYAALVSVTFVGLYSRKTSFRADV